MALETANQCMDRPEYFEGLDREIKRLCNELSNQRLRVREALQANRSKMELEAFDAILDALYATD